MNLKNTRRLTLYPTNFKTGSKIVSGGFNSRNLSGSQPGYLFGGAK